jgi:hypothetical protein
MAREEKFRPGEKIERLEGRELTTSLAGVGSAIAGVQRPQVEVRTVTSSSEVDSHNYHGTTGFFMA